MNNAHQCSWVENNKGAEISILTLNESACIGFTANALNVSIINLWPALLRHWNIYAAVLKMNHIVMWLAWQNINGAMKLKQSGATHATMSSCLTVLVFVVAGAAVWLSTGISYWEGTGKSMLTDIPAPLIGPLSVIFKTSQGETRSHIRIIVYQQHLMSIFLKDGTFWWWGVCSVVTCPLGVLSALPDGSVTCCKITSINECHHFPAGN